jgi:hypothetical protein
MEARFDAMPEKYSEWGLNMLKTLAFLIALSATTVVVAQENGPFGVTMGSDPLEYGCTLSSPGFYECDNLPLSHPSFDVYFIVAEEGVGTCRITGAGKIVTTNSRGTSLKSNADAVKDQLIGSYGAPELYDFLSPGSIWDREGDWMMGLLKEDRTYAYYWTKGPFKANVQALALETTALNGSTGYVSLIFEFANEGDCRSARKALESSVF